MESIQIICILYTVKKIKNKDKNCSAELNKKNICHFVQKIISSSIAQAHTHLTSVFLINFTNLHTNK